MAFAGIENYVQMAVEMNDSHRAIGLVDAPQQRKSYGVVTTKRDDTRKGVP